MSSLDLSSHWNKRFWRSFPSCKRSHCIQISEFFLCLFSLSQQSHSFSLQVEDPTLVTDLWLKMIINLCKTHLYKNAKKAQSISRIAENTVDSSLTSSPRLLLRTLTWAWYACINHGSKAHSIHQKSFHSKLLIQREKILNQSKPEIMPGNSTPSRGLAHLSAGMDFKQEGYSPPNTPSVLPRHCPVAAMAGESIPSALEQELFSPTR